MAIIDEVKMSLGISHSKKDAEILAVIEAAKHELSAAGVELITEGDMLTKAAIILYARSWFNFQGEAERYRTAFDATRNTMALLSEYKAAPDEE